MSKQKLKKDLTGIRFSRLLVLCPTDERRNKAVIYKCICDCGKEVLVRSYDLYRGDTKSCGCFRNERRKITAFRLKDGEAAFNALYANYMHGASKRKLEFNLDKSVFRELVVGACFYCGIPPTSRQRTHNNSAIFLYNGIDRIDPTRGYVVDNCVSCCKTCNRMKNTMSRDVFIKQVKLISSYWKMEYL